MIAVLVLWLAAGSACAQKKRGNDDSYVARKVVYEGHAYSVLSVKFPDTKVQLHWKDEHKQKLKSIGRLVTALKANGKELRFATNAGMYMEDNTPLGLYIEHGKQYRPLNLFVNKTGNFYLQPNGVFYLTSKEAGVVSSQEYKELKITPEFATQSGPMLVHRGTINSNFTKGSANGNIRSGVGIAGDGRVVFVISDDFVNFYDFATLFKAELKCENALFLDGSISRMYLPEINKLDTGGNFGAIIGIER